MWSSRKSGTPRSGAHDAIRDLRTKIQSLSGTVVLQAEQHPDPDWRRQATNIGLELETMLKDLDGLRPQRGRLNSKSESWRDVVERTRERVEHLQFQVQEQAPRPGSGTSALQKQRSQTSFSSSPSKSVKSLEPVSASDVKRDLEALVTKLASRETFNDAAAKACASVASLVKQNPRTVAANCVPQGQRAAREIVRLSVRVTNDAAAAYVAGALLALLEAPVPIDLSVLVTPNFLELILNRWTEETCCALWEHLMTAHHDFDSVADDNVRLVAQTKQSVLLGTILVILDECKEAAILLTAVAVFQAMLDVREEDGLEDADDVLCLPDEAVLQARAALVKQLKDLADQAKHLAKYKQVHTLAAHIKGPFPVKQRLRNKMAMALDDVLPYENDDHPPPQNLRVRIERRIAQPLSTSRYHVDLNDAVLLVVEELCEVWSMQMGLRADPPNADIPGVMDCLADLGDQLAEVPETDPRRNLVWRAVYCVMGMLKDMTPLLSSEDVLFLLTDAYVPRVFQSGLAQSSTTDSIRATAAAATLVETLVDSCGDLVPTSDVLLVSLTKLIKGSFQGSDWPWKREARKAPMRALYAMTIPNDDAVRNLCYKYDGLDLIVRVISNAGSRDCPTEVLAMKLLQSACCLEGPPNGNPDGLIYQTLQPKKELKERLAKFVNPKTIKIDDAIQKEEALAAAEGIYRYVWGKYGGSPYPKR